MPRSAAAPQQATNAGLWRAAAQYGVAVLLVAAATAVAFVLRGFVAQPSLTLFYVLAVVVAAVSFGWGPSMASTVLGALAYDFFFTRPYYSLAIDSPTDIIDATLLLAIAATVSALAAQARRRAQAAMRAAEQAEALQNLAHAVVQSHPVAEVSQAAAQALNRMFRVPSVVLAGRDGALTLAGRASVDNLDDVDWEAAEAAAETRVPTRGGEYPVESARFDFWPFGAEADDELVIGLDFSREDEGHPANLARLVELVGGYLTASQRRTDATGG
jgi:two-component system sensor histidine kinase KdpD